MTDAAAPLPLAAIVYSGHGFANELLTAFAFGLLKDGWQVQGLVQQQFGGRSKSNAMLVDLSDGQRFPLFQNLGTGSSACSLDQTSVAAASAALRRALQQRPDLAVANRFGALEAEGGGLVAEMLELVAEGVPLITVVSQDYLPNWRAVTGRAGVELAPSMEALRHWFAGIGQEFRPS